MIPGPRRQGRRKEAVQPRVDVVVVLKANAPINEIEGLTIHGLQRIEQALEAVRAL